MAYFKPPSWNFGKLWKLIKIPSNNTTIRTRAVRSESVERNLKKSSTVDTHSSHYRSILLLE